jgi:hypothetical protein
MKKNIASQHIGAQMITAADGTAFTGTVTVYITGDAVHKLLVPLVVVFVHMRAMGIILMLLVKQKLIMT